MSIYSGFATRHQEESYDECLDSVLYILQKRILKFYNNERTDEDKFITVLSKLNQQMKNMQNHKYLQPKSSNTFDELISFLKNKQLKELSVNVFYNQESQIQSEIISDFKTNNKTTEVLYRPPKMVQRQVKKQTLKIKDKKDSKPRSLTACNRIRNRHPSQAQAVSKNAKVSIRESIKKQKSFGLVKLKHQQFSNQDNSLEKESNRRKSKTIRMGQAYQQSFQEESIDKDTSRDSNDVRQLIRGYISRSKKNYIRSFKKKKSEIDNMLKNNM